MLSCVFRKLATAPTDSSMLASFAGPIFADPRTKSRAVSSANPAFSGGSNAMPARMLPYTVSVGFCLLVYTRYRTPSVASWILTRFGSSVSRPISYHLRPDPDASTDCTILRAQILPCSLRHLFRAHFGEFLD